jgi:hypothetical protein
MPNPYNSLKEVTNLGVLSPSPLNQINQVGLTNRDDFYRFTVGNRSRFDLKLSQIAKAANADVELYALKRPWNQVVRQIGNLDFRKLSAAARKANLQWVNSSKQNRNRDESIVGDLAPGEYCVRVLQRAGRSRYQLSLKAIAPSTPTIIPDLPTIIPDSPSNPVSPNDSDPIIRPSRPPASGNGYSITGSDETAIRAQFNLFSTASDGSLIQDAAEENVSLGLFTGAVENFVSGTGRLKGLNVPEVNEDTPFVPDSEVLGVKFAVLNLRAALVYDQVQQKGTLEYELFQEDVKNFKPGIDKVVFRVKFNLDANFPQSFDLDRSVNSLDYIVKNNLLGDPPRNGKSSGIGFSDYPVLKSNNSASGVEGGTILTSSPTTVS